MDSNIIQYRIFIWQTLSYNLVIYFQWIQTIDYLICNRIPLYPIQIKWHNYLKIMIPIWYNWIKLEYDLIMLILYEKIKRNPLKSCLLKNNKIKEHKRVSFNLNNNILI